MNGYLVMLRHEMDDIPLRLFPSRPEAVAFAETVTEDSDEEQKSVIRTDASTPVCVALYGFADDGMLVSCEVIKEFDDEPAAETA